MRRLFCPAHSSTVVVSQKEKRKIRVLDFAFFLFPIDNPPKICYNILGILPVGVTITVAVGFLFWGSAIFLPSPIIGGRWYNGLYYME